MLERIDFDKEKLSKESYKEQHKGLVERLIVLQQRAREKKVGMVVLFEGWDGAGKGSRISDLVYNLDARATTVHVTHDVPTEEIDLFDSLKSGTTGYYPPAQQFWEALGMKGTITFYDRGWYTTASQYLLHSKLKSKPKKNKKLFGSLAKKVTALDFAQSIESFERQLVDDGYVVVKLFLHVSKKKQKERLEKLRNDPATKWRVSKRKLKNTEYYDDVFPLYDALLERSNFSFCPWTILNGEDKRQTNIRVLETMIAALEQKLIQNEASSENTTKKKIQTEESAEDFCSSLTTAYPEIDAIKNDLSLDRITYRTELRKEQKRLDANQKMLFQKRIPLVIMYEGWDAAGKGGNIKRVAQALDARAYTIFPSASPTKPELLHPFLWRYWTRLPKAGHVGIYDRSWYGRVLVERVEGFASIDEWSRAYGEINAFECDLVNWGAIVLKFWVNVSQDEQLVRFKEREDNPDKQWKITDEDWRNREKYPEYKEAVNDMFRLTSTNVVPWIILESDDKLYARVKALRTINHAIEERLRVIEDKK